MRPDSAQTIDTSINTAARVIGVPAALAFDPEPGWGAVAVAWWQHDRRELSAPPKQDHVVIVQARAQVLAERSDGGPFARRALPRGAVTIDPAGRPTAWRLTGPVDRHVLYVPPPLLLEAASALSGVDPERVELIDRFGAADPFIEQVARILLLEARAPGPVSRLYMDALGQALAAHLLARHSSLTLRPEPPQGGLVPWRLRRATDYLVARLAEPVSLAELAGVAGLSRFHFARAFKQATGSSPHHWQMMRRVERAQDLLRDPTLAIAQVAMAVGYSDQAHLSRAFRAVTGTSPRKWRDGVS